MSYLSKWIKLGVVSMYSRGDRHGNEIQVPPSTEEILQERMGNGISCIRCHDSICHYTLFRRSMAT
jgi:hypothetical protein